MTPSQNWETSVVLLQKDIWILGIVLSIYHTFPKLPIIQTVSFNLGGKEAEVYIGKIKNT
jgi:hypothetical protein